MTWDIMQDSTFTYIRFLLVFSILFSCFFAAPIHSQNLSPDSIQVDTLDLFEDFERLDEIYMDEGEYGSGDGEEPPTYQGSWQKIKKDGTRGKQHFFHGIQIPEEDLDNVKILEIYSFNGGRIPQWIGKLKNLRELSIDYSNDEPLPKEIWSLHNIEVLRINYSYSKCAISPQIGQLKHLKRLVLQGYFNGVEGIVRKVPATIGNLSELEALAIRQLKIDQIPREICRLKKLRLLDLSFVGLASIPNQIGQLKQLDSLILMGNHITQLPTEIGMLSQLKVLDISGNALASLPAEIGSLQQLATLHLQNNELTSLPAELTSLHNLTYLHLSENRLTTLPNGWEQLTQLTFLDISKNRLQELPQELGKLHALYAFNASHNMLQALPENIGEMRDLHYLNCESNQLHTLPTSIGELQRLGSLNLKENPLTYLPTTIVALKVFEIKLDRRGLMHVAQPIWEFINRDGFKIAKIPTEIAGKPLAYYLEMSSIDPFAKRFVQGDLSLQDDSITLAINDSLLTENVETAPFYLYLLTTLITHKDSLQELGDEFQDPMERNSNPFIGTFLLADKAASFVLKHPCQFFEQFKSGPCQAHYAPWVSYCAGEICSIVRKEYGKCSSRSIADALRARMNPDCQAKYKKELFELVKTISQNPW